MTFGHKHAKKGIQNPNLMAVTTGPPFNYHFIEILVKYIKKGKHNISDEYKFLPYNRSIASTTNITMKNK